MKFKGHILRVNGQEYTLKDQLSEGGFSTIYSTSKPEVVCKIQTLFHANIAQAYKNEKNALENLRHINIVRMVNSQQCKLEAGEFGFMLLENCNQGTAFQILEREQGSLSEGSILKIMGAVASALEYIHSKGYSHRDIKLENVLSNASKEYKLCDFGSCTQEIIRKVDSNNRVQIEQYIQKTTTPLYRSPEQLDLYSGYQIGPKVDVFALGVLTFMLCFKKQPFETRLSAINKQYFLPQEHIYSKQLIKLIEDCFIGNPAERPSAASVKERVKNLVRKKKAHIDLNYDRQLDLTTEQMGRITEKNLKKTEQVESSFFEKIKRIYNQITTETEGWIIGFIENNEEAPNLKFNRSIISKCWEKRYKVEKFYDLLWRESEEHKSKSLVTLKLLTLLHNFLRKGPVEAVTFDGKKSPIKLCSKIYTHWKVVEKPYHPEDIKRNTYVILLIRMYALVIIAKVRLCYENSMSIEGNYSIVPFLMSKESETILRISLIQSMIEYLETCCNFHEILQKYSYLIDIQRTMILSIVDEEYCLISTLTFVFSTFKRAISYTKEDLDMKKLRAKIEQVENRFAAVYTKLHHQFKMTAKLSSLLEHNQFELNLNVVSYIKDIDITNSKKTESFEISKYLNYSNNICGLKIPLTYEEVIKNPNFLKQLNTNCKKSEKYIQLNDYKATSREETKKQEDKTKQSLTEKSKNSFSSDFSEFTFSAERPNDKKKQEEAEKMKELFKTMEFTHQNLNKDFMTAEQKKSPVDKFAADKFADFMSIVEEKYEQDKRQKQKQKEKYKGQEKEKQKQKEKQNINQQGLIDISKQVCVSMKSDINKLELINFFEDQDQEEKKKALSPKGEQKKYNVEKKVIEQKKQMISKIKEVNIVEQSSKSDGFIDLKGFIVEEVKKTAEQYVIDYSAIKLQKKIGFGHSSQVFKGEWRGRQVAVKKIKDDISSPNAEKEFKRQIMTSVKIRHHPNLVTLIGVAQHDNYFYIINEYCHGATLFDILHESKVPLPWRTRISIAKQISKAMLFLHTNEPPIIHRDLKSLNVLLVNKYSDKHPDSMQIKIADFGLSRDFATTYMTGVLGTYHWMAPQIFNNESYSLKADVYSFGIVLWEIVARKPPYLNMKNPQAIMKFVTVENGRPDLSELPSDCPGDLVRLMIRCWDRTPAYRPDFSEILQILTQLCFL